MLAPVISGIGMQSAAPGSSGMAPPPPGGASGGGSLAAPIFGQSAKLTGVSNPPVIPPSNGLNLAPGSTQSPLATNSIGSTSFASLAQSSSMLPAGDKEIKLKTDTKIIQHTAKTANPTDKTTDIDTLKKKLAMMERETSRLR